VSANYTRGVAPSPDAGRAWQLLLRLFFAQKVRPGERAGRDLSPAQCHVLHLLEPGRPVAMGRLAQTLSCDASNVTGLIDRLEARGYIRRQASPDDRRVKVLELTPAGCRRRAELISHLKSALVPLVRLSPSEQRKLVRLLEAVVPDDEDDG
jgi:DNA-binding MarR family transcriptional regulator